MVTPKPLSMDLRDRAVARVMAGETVRSVAAVLASVVKWSQRFRRTGGVAPGPMHGYRSRVLLRRRDWLISRTANDPRFNLRGLQDELAERGVSVDYRTASAFVHAEGLSFKKKLVLPSDFRAWRGRLQRFTYPIQGDRISS